MIGYFGSNHFESHHFQSQHWQPVPAGAAGASWTAHLKPESPIHEVVGDVLLMRVRFRDVVEMVPPEKPPLRRREPLPPARPKPSPRKKKPAPLRVEKPKPTTSSKPTATKPSPKPPQPVAESVPVPVPQWELSPRPPADRLPATPIASVSITLLEPIPEVPLVRPAPAPAPRVEAAPCHHAPVARLLEARATVPVARLLTSRLASRGGIRQVEVTIHADAAADAADQAVGRVWGELLVALRKFRTPHEASQHARHILRGLLPATQQALHGSLAGLATWGHKSATTNLVQTLPVSYLKAAVMLRRGGHRHQRRLREDSSGRRPGVVTLGVGGGRLLSRDEAEALREPARDAEHGQSQLDLFQSLLFPPPGESFVRRILDVTLGGQRWYQALDGAAKAAQFGPDHLAGVIASAFAGGEGIREIANRVLPFVDGVRWRARRTARTYGMAVAHETQMSAADQLGDLSIGWQINATLDEFTRPAHRIRSGTIYYKNPTGDQPGLDQMPNPPREADGSMAWNCRCFLTSVLSAIKMPTEEKQEAFEKVFTNAEDKVIPDPHTYSEWFAKADERRRRVAVGSRRYSAARDLLGRDPAWEDLIDPATGGLVGLDQLHAETGAERYSRVSQAHLITKQRAALLRRTAIFGTV